MGSTVISIINSVIYTLLLVILSTTILYLFYIDTLEKDIIVSISKTELQRVLYEEEEIQDLSIFDETCQIPILDPLADDILPYINPAVKKQKCNPTFEPKSYLVDGVLSTNLTGDVTCWSRCIFHVNDYEIKYGKWIVMENRTAQPECDTVEVSCEDKNNDVVYENLHLQITQKESYNNKSNNRPDVVILLIDSLSHSQYIRSMRMTRDFLQHDLKSIEFPYVTKVALNSRPNAYGFLLNEPIEKHDNKFGIFTTADFKPKLCQIALDDHDFIGFDFNRNGYVTMNNEDWQFGAVSWPGCKGFTKPFTNHTNKPFVIRATGSYKTPKYEYNLYKRSCKQGYQLMLDYLEEYTNKYEDVPKFSVSWFTDLAHANPNALYRVDEEFLHFFKRLNHKFEDSFILLMGDHGNRINDIRTTRTGEWEEKNPSLTIVLPKWLRDNAELVAQMRENSEKLVTHYDIYATLLEISEKTFEAYDDPDFTFYKFDPQNRALLGSSLFHPLPEPRNCFDLGIPLDYCFCEYKRQDFNDSDVMIQAGNLIVERINKDLIESALGSKCRTLTLDENDGMKAWVFDGTAKFGAQILKIKISVKPGRGQYEGLLALEWNGRLTLLTQEFPRIDSYESHAYCVKYSLYRQYCHCK